MGWAQQAQGIKKISLRNITEIVSTKRLLIGVILFIFFKLTIFAAQEKVQ
jgi:hypothetical protein